MDAKAFTMCELLILAAIMTIFFTMLLPALNKAQATSCKTMCASNMKLLGTACLLYGDENGYYPSLNNVPNYASAGWKWQIASLLQKTSDYRNNCMAAKNDASLSDGTFRCASFKDINPNLIHHATNAGGYGYNWCGGNGMGYQDSYIRIESIKVPGNMIMIGETADTGISALQSAAIDSPDSWETCPPGMRHFGNCNLAFADGHCSSMSRKLLNFKQAGYYYFYHTHGKLAEKK